MTIIPNLLLTGILAIFFSLLLLVWSVLFVQRRNGGLVIYKVTVTKRYVVKSVTARLEINGIQKGKWNGRKV